MKKKYSTTNHHRHNRVKIPLTVSAQWTEAKMADYEDSCRVRLIYDASHFNTLQHGPIGLSKIVAVRSYEQPLLSPPPSGWKQYGIMAVQKAGPLIPKMGMLVSIQWLLALEWKKPSSAWDALLFSLDHLHLDGLALPPTYLLPTLFIACMESRSADEQSRITVTSWGPMLRDTCKALEPLLFALYACWMDGPSTSAFRYRQFAERIPTDGTAYQPFLEPFLALCGESALDSIRSTEHLEASVMRNLREISNNLWDPNALPMRKQDLSTFLAASPLRALLPLALWQVPSPVKLAPDLPQLHSLGDVLHLWKHQMKVN